MFHKLNTLALGAFVGAQTNAIAKTNDIQARSTVIPASRSGKLEMAAGAGLAYLLYLLTVPAFADEKAQKGVVALLDRFTNFIVLLIAAFSVLMGVFAALQFVGSGGNTQIASKAKTTIRNVVIGLVLCAGVFIIKNAILSIVAGTGTGDENKFNKTLRDNGGALK